MMTELNVKLFVLIWGKTKKRVTLVLSVNFSIPQGTVLGPTLYIFIRSVAHL